MIFFLDLTSSTCDFNKGLVYKVFCKNTVRVITEKEPRIEGDESYNED